MTLIMQQIITDDGSTVLKQTISLADLQPSEAHRLSCTEEDVRLSTLSARERPYHWMWVIRFLGKSEDAETSAFYECLII